MGVPHQANLPSDVKIGNKFGDSTCCKGDYCAKTSLDRQKNPPIFTALPFSKELFAYSNIPAFVLAIGILQLPSFVSDKPILLENKQMVGFVCFVGIFCPFSCRLVVIPNALQ